ncbi:hypothetical protein BDV93DRAFT_562201 [Ceratobasidium sp. AG-I]|nr:hypothetical protein BDV93DRAFT_562201 [Ceratobasidium sp. AG-I]
MVGVDSSEAPAGAQNMSLKYTPPSLPAYLTNTFELKPVIGFPTDDEVKTIHAVIRAVETASQIPTLNDPGLSMELAQYLFDVQMARYREKYPVSIFPSANTYTPPTLPSHINVPLEPITGAPSDVEVKLVHTAFRASENLVNLPSLFDPDLSMNLSQHLFDIQFARYIQRTNEGRYTADNIPPNVEPNQPVLAEGTDDSRVPIGSVSDTASIHAPEPAEGNLFTGSERGDAPEMAIPRSDSPDLSSRTITLLENTRDLIEQMKTGQDQANQLLAEMQDTLKDGLMDGLKDILKKELKDALDVAVADVTRVVIKLHNISARSFNSTHNSAYHHIVNKNAEVPVCFVTIHFPTYMLNIKHPNG